MIKLTSSRSPFYLLPSRLKIGDMWFELLFEKPIVPKRRAELDWENQKIRIDPGLGANIQFFAYFHEVGHAIEYLFDLRQAKRRKATETLASVMGMELAKIVKQLYKEWRQMERQT